MSVLHSSGEDCTHWRIVNQHHGGLVFVLMQPWMAYSDHGKHQAHRPTFSGLPPAASSAVGDHSYAGELIVTTTTGKTTKKTGVNTYLYYAVAKNTDNPKWNLTDASIDIPPGHYTLHYDFKGAPYCTMSLTVTSVGAPKPTTVNANAISDGTGWGNISFEVK
jgi:hypothetical protein